MKSKGPFSSIDGVLVIDKAQGPTSHDIVATVRKAMRIKKVGHTGTLDPMATGVLPLVLGQGTKLAQYLSGGEKTYRGTILLGVTTTTLDAAGETLQTKPVTSTEAEVRTAVGSFVGEIEQIPPMYSAKKIQGQKLYELARKGVEVPREAKRVNILSIDVVSIQLPEVVIDVRCSAGTYVRVLAQDVGEKLGCGGHLKALRRLAAGVFKLEDAMTLQQLQEDPELVASRVIGLNRAVGGMSQIKLPSVLVQAVTTGYQLTVADLRTLDLPEFRAEQILALLSDEGSLVAVAKSLLPATDLGLHRRDTQALKTERVFLNS